jgi:DNA-directed RNA polymerase specialized sigma24 family protein
MAVGMNDELRAEIIRRFYGGASFRDIARAVSVDRKTVSKATPSCPFGNRA